MVNVKKLGLALSSLAFLLVNACSSVFTPQVENVETNNVSNETTESSNVEKKTFNTEAVKQKAPIKTQGLKSPLPKPSGSCPPPPPPPPIPKQVLDTIKKENPALLIEVEATKSLSFEDFHKKMADLAQKYPKYFKAPPPLPPAGSCPPPQQTQGMGFSEKTLSKL